MTTKLYTYIYVMGYIVLLHAYKMRVPRQNAKRCIWRVFFGGGQPLQWNDPRGKFLMRPQKPIMCWIIPRKHKKIFSVPILSRYRGGGWNSSRKKRMTSLSFGGNTMVGDYLARQWAKASGALETIKFYKNIPYYYANQNNTVVFLCDWLCYVNQYTGFVNTYHCADTQKS